MVFPIPHPNNKWLAHLEWSWDVSLGTDISVVGTSVWRDLSIFLYSSFLCIPGCSLISSFHIFFRRLKGSRKCVQRCSWTCLEFIFGQIQAPKPLSSGIQVLGHLVLRPNRSWLDMRQNRAGVICGEAGWGVSCFLIRTCCDVTVSVELSLR